MEQEGFTKEQSILSGENSQKKDMDFGISET